MAVPADPGMMTSEIYSFRLGDWECLVLSDGHLHYPPGHLFAGVPGAQIAEALRPYNPPADYVTTPCTHLCVHSAQHRVLVDMGAGRATPGTGRLRENLVTVGIEPASIDTVVITHAHPAHVGGTLDDRGRPLYAGARFYIAREEWDFWTSEMAFAKAPDRQVAIARANLEPIRDRLTLLDRESQVAPGIRILPSPGHTPGHMVVSLSSAGERLLYISDTVFHPLHIAHPNWSPIYDVVPAQAEATRRAILDLAAEEGMLVMGHHLAPFPGLGHVVRVGAGWAWRPIGQQAE